MEAKRFYSMEELRGALVVDSEALVYGVLGGARFTSDGVFLEVYVEYSVESAAPDYEKLASILRSRGVEPGEALEDLVAAARSLGLEIPFKKTSRPLRLLKGLVPLGEVELIDSRQVGGPAGEGKRESVVLLSTPREARYRGLRETPKPRSPVPGELLGKLVVSKTRGILGRVVEVVIGPGEPGLRASLTGALPGYLNWAALLRRIRRERPEAFEALANAIDYHREPRVGLERLEEVKALIEEHAPEYLGVLEEYIVREEARTGIRDVAWTSVLKVGDIVVTE